MDSKSTGKLRWVVLGFAPVLWCVWTTASAAVPLPMVVVNAAAIVAALVGIALPAGRRVGARGARALVPGGSALVLAGSVLLFFVSGAAVSAITLAAPRPGPADEIAPLDDSAVAAAHSVGPADAGLAAPTAPEVAAGPPPAVRVEEDEEAEAGSAEPEPVRAPTEHELEIEGEVSREVDRAPESDAFARVAARRRLPRDEVEGAVLAVGEYRNALADDVRRVAGRGVVGRVGPDVNVTRTDLGAFTATLSLTVIGCPERGLPDADLDTLARTALVRIAGNLPAEVEAFRAALWYEGLLCSRASLGYSASWTREGNRLTLR